MDFSIFGRLKCKWLLLKEAPYGTKTTTKRNGKTKAEKDITDTRFPG